MRINIRNKIIRNSISKLISRSLKKLGYSVVIDLESIDVDNSNGFTNFRISVCGQISDTELSRIIDTL